MPSDLDSKFQGLAQTESESVEQMLKDADKLLDSKDDPPQNLLEKAPTPKKNLFNEATKVKKAEKLSNVAQSRSKPKPKAKSVFGAATDQIRKK
jgi:hypothetical protein